MFLFLFPCNLQDPAHTLSQYGTWAMPHPGANEQGLRILVGAVAMAAGEEALAQHEIIVLVNLLVLNSYVVYRTVPALSRPM